MLTICAVILLLRSGASDQTAMTAEARQYVMAALDIMEKNALDRESIDWTTLRRDTLDRAAGAQALSDTYEAIRFAVRSLGDRHSSFQPPAAITEQMLAAVSPPPSGSLLESRLAHVVVPQFRSLNQQTNIGYATALQTVIRNLDQQNPCGWIVDLRQNRGGNMWPMLAGLGPLLDAGPLGWFADRKERGPAWSYHDGAAWSASNMNTPVTGTPYELRAKQPPIAVLIGATTSSSGEAIAIAFQGNRNTRTFGDHTRGLTTANGPFALSDGAILNLAQGFEVDRNGRPYEDGVTPDEEADPAGEAVPSVARNWLLAQPACRLP